MTDTRVPNPEEHPLLTSTEVASILRRSPGTVNRAIRAGELPSVSVGGRRYVPTAKLCELVGLGATA